MPLGRAGLAGLAIVAWARGLVAGGRPEAVALDAVVGAAFILSGLTLWRRPRTGRIGTLYVATALGWGLGGVLHRGPLAHLLLTYPSGQAPRWIRLVIVAAYVDAVVESAVRVEAATLLFSIGLAAAAVTRTMTARPATQRAMFPATIAAVVIASVLGLGRTMELLGVPVVSDQLVVYEVVLIITAIGLAALVFRGRSSIATGVVANLGGADDSPLRARLAHALGDPSLVIGYAVGDPVRYVDEVGRTVELSDTPARTVTQIDHGARPIAILVHDPTVLADPRAVEEVKALTRIAVENLRLREEIEARTVALDDSQRRLIEAVDLERRQIERQLDTNVLARLDRVLNSLMVSAEGDAAAAPWADVARQLDATEDDLRALARGLYPVALAEIGLHPALDELVRTTAVPARCSVRIGRLPASIEATAYFVCAEALSNVTKHAHASHVEIDIEVPDGRTVRIAVSDDGIGGADPSGTGLDGLRARVEGLGGLLSIISPVGHGTRVEASLPITRDGAAVSPRSAARGSHAREPD